MDGIFSAAALTSAELTSPVTHSDKLGR